ncbi:MAG: hypothetical protein IIX14_08060 [Clostridia bacterium]|nr:hypothetical protein [Clostridia bacterium]
MKDEKSISASSKEEIVYEKNTSDGYTQESLNNELEKLAQLFSEELKKAEALSDEDFVEAYADEEGIIPDEDLCECCGEHRKDKKRGASYQYCAQCRENMKSYPFSVLNVLVVVVIIALSVMSVINFCTDFYGYDMIYKAEKAERANKLDTALGYYNSAIDEFDDAGVVSKKANFRSAEIMFMFMDEGSVSMQSVAQRIEKALTPVEKKLPLYGSAIEMRDESLVLYGTMQEFYTIISAEEYAEYKAENTEMYEEIMGKVAGIAEKEISVVSLDGKTTSMVPANKAMVYFCQYMFAYISQNYDDAFYYMDLVEQEKPEYLWLYAYERGVVEAQTGDVKKAKTLADKLIAANIEDADGYSLYTTCERLYGNYEKAIRWADKGLSYAPDNAELMRMKAMALCCKGENEAAQKVINEAFEVQEYAVLYLTALVVENEMGNTARVDEIKTILSEEKIELSDRMNDYLSGKITAQQLFTEGTGEVE